MVGTCGGAPLTFPLQRSDLWLRVITPKATVHRFAVVHVRVRRRIFGAFDLIVHRDALPFPESEPRQPGNLWKPNAKDRDPDPGGPRILLRDPTPADRPTWTLPGTHSPLTVLDIVSLTHTQDWNYIVYPKPEVFKMPLPSLLDQIRLGPRQANREAVQ